MPLALWIMFKVMVALALLKVKYRPTPTYNMSTPLPGEIQTNNRAEIYAILIMVQNISWQGK